MQAALDWQPYLVVLALLVLLFTLLRSMRRRLRRQMGEPPSPPGPRPRRGRSEADDLRRAMEKLLVELQEVSREVNAQLDTKMRALMQLTREAQQQIERLEALLAIARGKGRAEECIPSTLSTPSTAAPEDPRRERIYQLADQGLSPVEIARRLDQPVGEVELILSLRQDRPPDGGSGPPGGQIDLRT